MGDPPDQWPGVAKRLFAMVFAPQVQSPTPKTPNSPYPSLSVARLGEFLNIGVVAQRATARLGHISASEWLIPHKGCNLKGGHLVGIEKQKQGRGLGEQGPELVRRPSSSTELFYQIRSGGMTMQDYDSFYSDFLGVLADGQHPDNGDKLDSDSIFSDEEMRLALKRVVTIAERKGVGPRKVHFVDQAGPNLPLPEVWYPTAMEAAKAELGLEFQHESKRFEKGHWFVVDSPGVVCRQCGHRYVAFRPPYRTKAGFVYHYWALACDGCRHIVEPSAIPDDDRGRVYRASRHRPGPKDNSM